MRGPPRPQGAQGRCAPGSPRAPHCQPLCPARARAARARPAAQAAPASRARGFARRAAAQAAPASRARGFARRAGSFSFKEVRFLFRTGPARSFRVSAPSGFDHIPAPFPETILSNEIIDSQNRVQIYYSFPNSLYTNYYYSSYFSFTLLIVLYIYF